MRTGTLKEPQLVLVWKYYDNVPSNDKYFYSPAGSRVRWDGTRSNAGHESSYGGRSLLWAEVWNEELNNWMGKGLETEEVEWDD